MSKQTSLITFKGKMGGISFYTRNGVHVARKAGGPDRSRILKDPKFERTRENMSEFTCLALANASFSKIFSPVKNLRATDVRSRVSKIFRAIIKSDEGLRGQRQILLSQYRDKLISFEVGESTLKSAFGGRYISSHAQDRKTATLNIADLRANTMVTAPLDATHFQLVQLCGVISDVVYNQTANGYELADASADAMGDVSFSDYIPVNSVDAVSVNLQTSLNVDVLSENVSVVQALGILFFTKNGTAYYPIQQGKAMRIVDVF